MKIEILSLIFLFFVFGFIHVGFTVDYPKKPIRMIIASQQL
jgi:hypothetical protein